MPAPAAKADTPDLVREGSRTGRVRTVHGSSGSMRDGTGAAPRRCGARPSTPRGHRHHPALESPERLPTQNAIRGGKDGRGMTSSIEIFVLFNGAMEKPCVSSFPYDNHPLP